MTSPFHLHHKLISWQRKPPQDTVMLSSPFSCWYHPDSSEKIEGHLSEQGINSVFDQPWKSGPKGIVVEMRDAKILLNNITNF